MKRLIAYLGILASIILGGILGLIALVLAFGALEADLGIVHLLIGIALGAFLGGILAVSRVRRYLGEGREKQLAKYLASVPDNAGDIIKSIIRQMRYRKKVRQDVMAELSAHFEDELKDCKSEEERDKKAQKLIEDFGDVKLLAVLLRRAKKRCRPLWRTVVTRAFQTVGILILCFIIYTAWFLTGKPVVTVDYVAELNRIVRPVADENLNAAPLYVEAAELVDKLPDETKELLSKKYNEVTPEQKQLIEKWLESNNEALELVIAGSQKPYYWPKYETGEENTGEMMAVLLPHLSGFRSLTRALRLRAHLRAEQGRYEDAFDDMKACYRFGQHLRGDKFFIEQLVGMALERLATQTLRDILGEHEIDPAILATLQNDFEQMIADEDFSVSFKFAKLCLYDEIQRCFTEDRIGSGHISLEGFRRFQVLEGLSSSDYDLFEGFLTKSLHVLFTHPNKQESREMVDRYYDTFWDKITRKTPAQIQAENIDIEKQAMELVKGNILLEILTPAIGRVCEIAYRNKIDVEAALAVIAMLRYRQDKGGYPESLGKLIEANYLRKLPLDPFSDSPLVYKKTDDDFILYSIGQNFKDDGGLRYSEHPWGGYDKGDRVFWPVENYAEREKRLEKERKEKWEKEREERQQRLKRQKRKSY